MKLLIVILCCAIALTAAPLPSIVVDAGSGSDSQCAGGVIWNMDGLPAGADTTLRYTATSGGVSVPFTCTIQAEPGTPYGLELTFTEPNVTGPGLRSFSVSLNGRVVVDHLDVFKAAGGNRLPIQRYALDFPVDGKFTVTFTTHIRSAVVTTLKFTPLSGFPPNVTYIKTQDPKKDYLTDLVPFRCPGCQNWMIPRPPQEPDATVNLLFTNLSVYRNGLRMIQGSDYFVQQTGNQLGVHPTGPDWPDTDVLRADYVATWPLAADAMIPIVMNKSTCEGFGPTWDCRGLELIEFETATGVKFGPFIGLRATAEEAASPNWRPKIGYGPWILKGVKQ